MVCVKKQNNVQVPHFNGMLYAKLRRKRNQSLRKVGFQIRRGGMTVPSRLDTAGRNCQNSMNNGKGMKNNLAIIIAVVLVISSGCSKSEPEDSIEASDQTVVTETNEETNEAENTVASEEVKDYSNASLSDICNYTEIMSNFFPSGFYDDRMIQYDRSDAVWPENANEVYRVTGPYTTIPEAISYLKQYYSPEMVRRMHEYFISFRVFNGKLYYCIPARGFGCYNYESGELDHVEPDGTYVVKIMYENVGSGMFEPTYHYFRETDGRFLLVDVDFNGTEDELFTNSCIGLVSVNAEHIRIRTGAGTSFPQISGYWNEAENGGIYPVYETKEADGYIWYRIGDDQWFASDGSWATFYEIS